ncbi:MAG: hypothetical protein EA383_06840 [Spirochaetaceae bacterium]|nr:MAG: hypothetical protein EA383_06840 [Spirochaetaceae bacterium]
MIDELIPEHERTGSSRPDLIVVFPEGVITPPREEILEDFLDLIGLSASEKEPATDLHNDVYRLILSSSFLSMSREYFLHALSEQFGRGTDELSAALEQALSPSYERRRLESGKSRNRYQETVQLLTRLGELFPLFLWNDLPDFVLNPLVTDHNDLFARCIRRKFAPGQPSLSDAVEELIEGNEAGNPLFIAWNPQVLYPLVSRGLDAIVHADADRLRRELVLRGVALEDIETQKQST